MQNTADGKALHTIHGAGVISGRELDCSDRPPQDVTPFITIKTGSPLSVAVSGLSFFDLLLLTSIPSCGTLYLSHGELQLPRPDKAVPVSLAGRRSTKIRWNCRFSLGSGGGYFISVVVLIALFRYSLIHVCFLGHYGR